MNKLKYFKYTGVIVISVLALFLTGSTGNNNINLKQKVQRALENKYENNNLLRVSIENEGSKR